MTLLSTLITTLTCLKLELPRLHSRHRRFIAPGARWDLMAGFEILYDDAEVRFDIVNKYEMDYLFGGTAALAAAIAAAEAAAAAAASAEAATLAAAGKKKRKRSLEEEFRWF